MIYGADRTAQVTSLTPSWLADGMPSGNGDLCTTCTDPATISIGSVLSCQLTTPKGIALESPSFFIFNCSVSHLRRLGYHLKLSDGALPVPLDSPPSKTSLKRKGRYISVFPARALRRRRAAFGRCQFLTSFAIGYPCYSRDFQLAADNFPLSSMNFRASSE